MKLNNNTNSLTTNNVENKSVDFGIGDPAMVIRILRKHLYGNPIQTLVQEYISNARDACREAGKALRVIVTMPTETNKVFKVRDYGNGIDPDRMNNVFVKFASSTKRSDNTQTGGFGIGAKSAWAYTDNFTIISYTNGIARHYIAHIAKNDTGTLELVNEVQTNEANGTEISIAVAQKDMQAFNAAVFRCTYFWDVKPELRGIGPSEVPDWYKEPKCIDSILNVKFYSKDFNHFGYDNYLVIDGIPYPLSYHFLSETYKFIPTELKYAVFIETGVIEVSANREVITDNDNTKEKLGTIFANLKTSIEKYVKQELAKSSTLAEFLASYKKFSTIYFIDDQEFKGYAQNEKLTDNNFNKLAVNNVCLMLEKTSNGDKYRLESEENSWHKLYNYHYLYSDKTIDQVSKVTLYNKVRTFLNQFSEAKPRKAVVFFKQVDVNAFNDLVKQLQAINLDSIEVEKKAPSQKRPVNEVIVTVLDNVRSYRSRCGHDSLTIDLNTNTDQYVYVVKESVDKFTEQKNSLIGFCAFLKAKTTYKFCFVAESNAKKLQGNDKFITVEEFNKNPFDKLSVDIEKEIIAEYKNDARSDAERFFNIKGILDKELTDIVSKYKNRTGNYYSNTYSGKIWDQLKLTYKQTSESIKKVVQELEKEKTILERYPLVDRYVKDVDMPEYLWYINTKYKQMYEK